MFGFVQTNVDDLTKEEKERYHAVYCGLCQTLGGRHGFYSRMALTYDLTFLTLLLSSLYEEKEISGKSRCITHPCKLHSFSKNKYTEYAADMTVALTYHKCLDDWNDEKKIPQKCYSAILSGSYKRVKKMWPRQCEIIERELKVLADIEKEKPEGPDAAANSFGRLMAGIFVPEEDFWSDYLRNIGYGLGKFIYIADAAIDFEEDLKKNNYNPLKGLYIEPKELSSTLKVFLGEVSTAFEGLPLVQDVNLLRNILYSGIWIKYNRGMQKEKREK